MKVIIDCDPGIDDVYALAVAMLNVDVDILAITIANGNTAVENGAINAKLALNTLFPHKKNPPPIYLGSPRPLLHEPSAIYFYHRDGLAGCHETLYKREVDSLREGFFKEVSSSDSPHAVNKIIELVNENPNEVVLIAIGGLTNLALAVRLCHDPAAFTRKIKKLVIMGGNEPDGFSNGELLERTLNYPEFNFSVDPIAAKVVMDNYMCPISVYTFDFCLRALRVKTSEIVREFNNYIHKSKACRFLERICMTHQPLTDYPEWFYSCDLVALLACFHGEACNAVYKKLDNYTVLSANDKLDGLLVPRNDTDSTCLARNDNVSICITMNLEKAFEIFKEYLKKLAEHENAF